MIQRTLRILAPGLLASLTAAIVGCGGSAGGGEDVGSSDEAISTNERTAYEFFVAKGLKDFQAAGIVGNLEQESNVDPTIAQYGGGPGRGIAQWSEGDRWNASHDDNVAWYAGTQHTSEWSLKLQLTFIWYELEHFDYGLSELRASTDVSEATIVFQDRYEICGACDESTRISYAEAVLRAYGKGGGGGGGGAGCYSDTKGKEMPFNACVQSRSDDLWYQCDNGSWVDRWTDPAACDGVYPL